MSGNSLKKPVYSILSTNKLFVNSSLTTNFLCKSRSPNFYSIGDIFVNKFLDERNAAYDHLAKRLLARKSILAHILKYTVEEFAECSLYDIEKKYIEGEPSLSINTVPLDDTLDIIGKNTESASLNESFVTFDIIFDAIAPSTGEPIKLIINIEPQKTTRKIHYKLMKRAVYYAARLISSQKEKEFHGDECATCSTLKRCCA